MQRQPSASGILSDLKQPCVEIALWGITSLRNRLYLEQTLARYALGAGPLRAEKDKLLYRFLMSDWEQIIRPLVGSNSIAFETVKNYETDRDILPVKKKVYLVENDLDTLFALNVILEDAGYDVLLSHCARPLMEDILPPTDLFILDNCMPDGEGLEIYSKLMSRAETKHTPVIMISADHDIQSRAMAAGVDDFLEKPFEMKELLRIVARHTNAAALERLPSALRQDK